MNLNIWHITMTVKHSFGRAGKNYATPTYALLRAGSDLNSPNRGAVIDKHKAY
jgi:hypothetical protein